MSEPASGTSIASTSTVLPIALDAENPITLLQRLNTPPPSSETTESRRKRRKREKKQARDDLRAANTTRESGQEEGSSKAAESRNMTPNGNDLVGSFEAVEDFIALVDSENEEPVLVNGKIKGKEKEQPRDDDDHDTPSAGPSQGAHVSQTDQPRTREWDRGKTNDTDRNGKDKDNGKRTYTMAFDPNDGYENKKQRTDAKSRKSPWVKDIQWERCRNVAELYVSL